MDYKDLEKWLRTQGTYKDGVIIYNALGDDFYLKNTFFKRSESAFTMDKLRGELGKILKNTRPLIEVPIIKPVINKVDEPPKQYKGLATEDFFTLPKELQEDRLQISKLYSEAMNSRRMLRRLISLPSNGVITLEEAFNIMSQIAKNNKGIPFNLVWITYNEQTGEGGEVKQLDCILKFGNKTATRYSNITAKQSDKRDARHDIHGTFNVQVLNTIEIRKVHTWLIMQVNGLDVVMGG